MRWQNARRSTNVENRRGGGLALAGGGGGLLAVAVIVFLLGGDPTPLLLQGGSQIMTQISPEEEQKQVDFVSAILGSTEDVWHNMLSTYQDPGLVLFSGAVQSDCGMADAAMGPFYCPLDHKVYLDLLFFRDLEKTYDAPGDFARAYVIAHEVGHHVQTLSGISDRVRRLQASASQSEANELSVRMELQADCYAGLWAHSANAQYQLLEPGDIEEALNAASQIGDDRLQKQAQSYVVPDSFTHGRSDQRYHWFERGFKSGDIKDCDTFSGKI